MLRYLVRIPLLHSSIIFRNTCFQGSKIYPKHISFYQMQIKDIKLFAVLRRLYSENVSTEHMIVDFEKVKAATNSKNTYIIDVREPEELKEHGKIPNSINIPLGNVSSALGTMSEKEFEKMFNTPKPTEESEIIFYCMIGKRSGMAQQNAINLGYKNVKNYLGSWTDWANKTQ